MADGSKSDTDGASSASTGEQGTSGADSSTGTSTGTAESGPTQATSDNQAADTTTVDGQRPIATTTSAGTQSTAAGAENTAAGDTAAEKKPAASAGNKSSRKSKTDGGKGSGAKSRLAKSGEVVKKGSDLIRNRIASVVWLIAVLAAIVLAVGALLYALDANMKNAFVTGILDLAKKIDGPFWRIFEFHQDKKGPGNGPHDATKEHLVNWGLAAVAYLIAGRVLDRAIRP